VQPTVIQEELQTPYIFTDFRLGTSTSKIGKRKAIISKINLVKGQQFQSVVQGELFQKQAQDILRTTSEIKIKVMQDTSMCHR
jgi:hypothetical protein